MDALWYRIRVGGMPHLEEERTSYNSRQSGAISRGGLFENRRSRIDVYPHALDLGLFSLSTSEFRALGPFSAISCLECSEKFPPSKTEENFLCARRQAHTCVDGMKSRVGLLARKHCW